LLRMVLFLVAQNDRFLENLPINIIEALMDERVRNTWGFSFYLQSRGIVAISIFYQKACSNNGILCRKIYYYLKISWIQPCRCKCYYTLRCFLRDLIYDNCPHFFVGAV